jgi:predicted nucleotidyltransferase
MKKYEIFERVKKEVLKDYPSAKIILYGSRARGDFEGLSDWDFLILVNEEINFNQKLEINDKLFAIELEIDEILSPIIHNTSEWSRLKDTPFYKNVQQDGILI